MDYNYQQSQFSRAMLTGLFVGIVATILCLVYNIIYRESTGFQPSDFINVSSLIFVVNLAFWVIGIIYFICLKIAKKGDLVFEILFALLTLFCIWKTELVQRATSHELTVQFRGLLLGIIIIMAIGAFLIPYLFHSKKFEEHVV